MLVRFIRNSGERENYGIKSNVNEEIGMTHRYQAVRDELFLQ